MDTIDGIQLINLIKNSQSLNANTPIVLMTSGEAVEDMFDVNNMPNLILKKDQSLIVEFNRFYETLPRLEVAKVKVLYIDDDPFIRKMIQLWMTKEDAIELTLCSSVAEFKDLTDLEFDMIVSDNLLKDGELVDILGGANSTKLKNVPILVHTGTVSKLNFYELKSKGNIIDILPKPFEMSEFLKRLDAIKRLKSV